MTTTQASDINAGPIRGALAEARAALPKIGERETVYCSLRGDHLRVLVAAADPTRVGAAETPASDINALAEEAQTRLLNFANSFSDPFDGEQLAALQNNIAALRDAALAALHQAAAPAVQQPHGAVTNWPQLRDYSRAIMALQELRMLWPNWRQLVDGFTVNSSWNEGWDKQVRDSMIAFGLKHLANPSKAAPAVQPPHGDLAVPPVEAPAFSAEETAPIDMVLYCPKCGMQHIDAPENKGWFPGGECVEWDNPPHRSHLCHGCGHIWRPADVPTNGVAAVKTKGQNDSPVGSCGA